MKYPTPELAAGMNRLLSHVKQLQADYWVERKYTYAHAPTVDVDSIGPNFARVVTVENHLDGTSRTDSVYCFVAMRDGSNKELGEYKEGDIFKAASWKKPAKHKRGNIFTDLSGCRTHGMEYLR